MSDPLTIRLLIKVDIRTKKVISKCKVDSQVRQCKPPHEEYSFETFKCCSIVIAVFLKSLMNTIAKTFEKSTQV